MQFSRHGTLAGSAGCRILYEAPEEVLTGVVVVSILWARAVVAAILSLRKLSITGTHVVRLVVQI